MIVKRMLECGYENNIDTCWFDWKGQEDKYKPTYIIKKLENLRQII